MPSVDSIEQWLAENVRRYGPSDHVVLDRFQWPKPNDYSGSFSVLLGEDDERETFHFFADGAGEIQLQEPLFVSPLGAPASFGAISIPQETAAAVRRGIRSVVPRLKPYGIDPDTKRLITTSTAMTLRTNSPIATVRDRLLKTGFYVKVDTKALAVSTPD